MNKQKKILKFSTIILMFFFFFLVFIAMRDKSFSFKEDGIELLIMGIFMGLGPLIQYFHIKRLEKKEALKFSGKIVKAKIEEFIEEYRGNSMSFYLIAKNVENGEEHIFKEEFDLGEYEFLQKHFKKGDEIPVLVDYQDSEVFFIDFEMLLREYQKRSKLTHSGKKIIKGGEVEITKKDLQKIFGFGFTAIAIISLVPLFVFIKPSLIQGSPLYFKENISSILTIWLSIAGIFLLSGIYLIRKSKKQKVGGFPS